MSLTLPDNSKLKVPSGTANKLLDAAERLPYYENVEYYSPGLQQFIHDQVRETCPEDFDRIILEIKKRLTQFPFCAIVQGLNYDPGNKLFVAVNRALGPLVARPYEKPRAQLVHYIQPETDRKSSRGNHYETEKFHTDTADWDTPVGIISMLCVRPDRDGGGRSLILDINTLRNEVEKRLGVKTLNLLETTPVPWKKAEYLGGGLKWRTIINESSICWRRYTIDFSQNSLSSEFLEALDAFEDVIDTTSNTIDFLMEESELLFLDNHRTLHARTPVSSKGMSHRLMIRSWIRTDKNEKEPIQA